MRAISIHVFRLFFISSSLLTASVSQAGLLDFQGSSQLKIVDEAQNLTMKSLESLRMLSNISVYKHQLLQVILVGQPQLKSMLMKPELEQFNQRVSVEFFLTP